MKYSRSRSADAAPVFRLQADCPWCQEPLVLKRRRADGKPFLSCSDYPQCDFTEDYHPELLHYARSNDHTVAQLREALRQVTAERDDLRRLQQAPPASSAERQMLGKMLTQLLTICHPDRWQDSPVATEITKHLIAVRDRLKEGAR